ncbi:glycerophosphodiester phosphodiesterase domain-containing protein 4-like isoform X6 [Vicugna pacos]|uniref:Glycerophosphodiester phosphodiesterase domain-containing protein 4-like isoform X6 n=1 Tax=Vicugna pacos TaxID=30538 RepID=A0ABM5DWG4_VICPA
MHNVNNIETESQETGRWRNFNSWIKRNFNYECYLNFLTGCYSCKLEAEQRKKSRRPLCCCSLLEILFYPWLLTALYLSVLLVFVWVESSNEYNGFDWVVFLGTGVWFFWSLVLLSLFGILAAYTSLLLVLGFLLCWEGKELYLHWYHKILILIVISMCLFFFWLLCTYWKDRWLTIGLSLQVYAPYLHLSSISVMVLLSWPVAFYLIHLEGEARIRRYKITSNERKRNKRCNMLTKLRALQVAVGLPFFLILLCLYVMPFGNYSPCIQEKDKLGPKPSFFGHRGAPMLGPENTMMSFEKAVEHGAFGLESDVHISYDRVPFLMHDLSLRRTTNIKEVLPNASLRHPSLFNWDFLSTLNAGKWFSHSQIVWLPGFDRKYVRSTAPGFQHVGRLFTIERLTKENISRINVDYKRLFYNGLREYKAANININIYIVNEPWLFSLAWCSRIQSVTTDNIQVLNQINHPYFFMTPSFYMFMWILLDVVSAIFIFAVFYFHWWRESQSEKILKGISSYTETPSVSLQKENTENEAALNIMESPETLTKSVGELPGSQSVNPEPVQETTQPLMP